MSEWWTYRLSDFLMFSPRTYWRLVERYNEETWPIHVLALGAGVLLLWLAAARSQAASRAVLPLLAGAWLWVAWAFHLRSYGQINLGARYMAAAFAVQASLLIAFGLRRGRADPGRPLTRRQAVGWAVAAAAVFLYPLGALLTGKPWTQAEVFGAMPEPTALATLGLLLATGRTGRGALLVIPAASLAAGWITLWLMHGQ